MRWQPAGIIFDLYGTLLDVRSVEKACAGLVGDPAAFVGLWRRKQLEYTFVRALMGRYADFWSVTGDALDFAAETFGLRLSAADRQRLREAWVRLEPFPDVRPGLEGLSRWPLGVLSNGSPAMVEAALDHSGLRPHFSHVLSVDAARTYKPSPQVYALGPGAFGAPPDRLLFVSANGFDAAGAKAYGYRVCYLNRGGTPPERLGLDPDFEVRTLQELVTGVLPAQSSAS